MVENYLLFHANDSKERLYNNEELFDFLVTITSSILTLGIAGTTFISFKILSLSNRKEEYFKEFVDKK